MQRAIGIFDSGIGGLTVYAAIKKRLPEESLIYFGDTARVPYGNKSEDTIIKYSLQSAHFLAQRGIKALVIACNTSSAYSLSALKKEFDFPIIGVIEPGVKAALALSPSKHIGVIGTHATINSNAYAKLIKKMEPKARVVSQACPLFVPLAEEGWVDNEVARETAEIYLSSFKKEKIDSLILGCTHYPLLKSVIKEVVGEEVSLIDSAEVVAETLKDELSKADLLISKKSKGSSHFYVTDLPSKFESVAFNFLGKPLASVKRVDL